MEEIINLNKGTYDTLAPQYELKVSERKKFNESVIDNFIEKIVSGKNVLDLGCAVGLETSIFLNRGFSVTGVEISEEMIKYAKKRNPDGNFILGNFLDIDFSDKFDAIFAQSFIHLFPKEESVEIIKKIKGLLKERGVAFITTSKSEESKEGLFVKDDYQGECKRFRKFWTKEELTDVLNQVGFAILDYYEIRDPYDKLWMVFTLKNPNQTK